MNKTEVMALLEANPAQYRYLVESRSGLGGGWAQRTRNSSASLASLTGVFFLDLQEVSSPG